MNYNYSYNFYHTANKYPKNIAIVEKGTEISYEILAKKAQGIAYFLRRNININESSKIGILGSRSINACLGIISSGWAGCSYVPISPKLPIERIKKILQMSNLSALIVDQEGYKLLTENLLDYCPDLILSSYDDSITVNFENLVSEVFEEPAYMPSNSIAYLIFTSGTTGIPKGVNISCSSLNSFTKNICELFSLNYLDRTVETCELNFDFSVYNMFAPWSVGATLYIIPREQMMNTVKFIKKNNITVWSSVPSVIFMLQKTKSLTPGSLATIRLSAFCGEPLTVGLINEWSKAAPNGVIKNLYGPTEATVFCLNQNVELPYITNPNSDIYAIGKAFEGNEAMIFNTIGEESLINKIGELAISGKQLAINYHNENELTLEKFITFNNKRWYLTGDLAVKDEVGIFYCMGRLDNQVKYLGHRIELEEIDSYIRKYSHNNMVATVLLIDGENQKLIAFIESQEENVDVKKLYEYLKKELPYYMIPSEIKLVNTLPLTQNGKINRSSLALLIKGKK